jgi:hypothetical protein
MPPALTEAAAVIGPPVSAFLAASSLNDKGGKSPTLLEAGVGLTVLERDTFRNRHSTFRSLYLLRVIACVAPKFVDRNRVPWGSRCALKSKGVRHYGHKERRTTAYR